jgi:hypothetical protein
MCVADSMMHRSFAKVSPTVQVTFIRVLNCHLIFQHTVLY